jgi:hypothetical protein
MKMELNEAIERLDKAGFLVEDKYMDDMDKELDHTVTLNNILSGLKEEGYEISGIKNDKVYVWPVKDNERFCVVIEINEHRNIQYPYDYYCFVLDREKRSRIMSWGYTVTNEDKCYYDPCISYIKCYTGPVKEICKPAEKKLNKLTQPGFFKRLFHKESAQESVETLSKAGFLVEASDKAKSIRDQITRVAIEKFEEIPYDEFEQEPWEDSDAIDAIPDEKFFEVMKSAINAKTQEEVLQAAEDEDKFNILADAWLEYLSDLSGYVGWEYTWNRDY